MVQSTSARPGRGRARSTTIIDATVFYIVFAAIIGENSRLFGFLVGQPARLRREAVTSGVQKVILAADFSRRRRVRRWQPTSVRALDAGNRAVMFPDARGHFEAFHGSRRLDKSNRGSFVDVLRKAHSRLVNQAEGEVQHA